MASKSQSDAADFIAIGLITIFFGGAVGVFLNFQDATTAAWIAFGVLGFIGQVVLTIGIIAKGVEVGMRSVRRSEQRAEPPASS